MTLVGRGSLPQNYHDLQTTVTPAIRLRAPEPQYIFAQMLMGGRFRAEAMSRGAINAEQFAIMNGGGVSLPPNLDRLVRFADVVPNAVLARNEFGKGRGDTIKLDRPVRSGGGYTLEARKRVQGRPTSTTGIRIVDEQVAMVLEHYRGPYASDGTEVQPYEVEEFDAIYRANRESIVSKVVDRLTFDRVKWLNAVGLSLWSATSNITLPEGITTVSAFVSGGGAGASFDLMQNGRKGMSDREWPPFPSGKYMALVPTSWRIHMAQDPIYARLAGGFKDEKNPIYGFIGEIEDVMYAECSTLNVYTAGQIVPGSGSEASRTVPSGVTLHEALIFGPEAVGYGVGQDVEMRFDNNNDYGAVARCIWDSKEAFKLLDERAVQRVLYQVS